MAASVTWPGASAHPGSSPAARHISAGRRASGDGGNRRGGPCPVCSMSSLLPWYSRRRWSLLLVCRRVTLSTTGSCIPGHPGLRDQAVPVGLPGRRYQAAGLSRRDRSWPVGRGGCDRPPVGWPAGWGVGVSAVMICWVVCGGFVAVTWGCWWGRRLGWFVRVGCCGGLVWCGGWREGFAERLVPADRWRCLSR